MNEYFDIEGTVKLCHEKCKVDLEEVKRFELTTDLGNLPKGPELKCYFYCVMETCGVFKTNSTQLNVAFMMDLIEKLPREEQDIIFRMGKLTIEKDLLIKLFYSISSLHAH